MTLSVLNLSFYGIRVRVAGPAELIGGLRLDFSWFEAPEAGQVPDVTVTASGERPPRDRVPPVTASLYLPDAIVYSAGTVRYVDYAGKALGIFDYASETGELFAEDPGLLHELAYLMVHSRAGELLDRRGLHRVHALGISVRGKGLLCLLPQGAGKTTLCQGLLGWKDVKILADDIPLVSRSAELMPFPLRMGVNEVRAQQIPPEYRAPFVRRKYGSKTLISVEYFRQWISPAVPCSVILVGERRFGPGAQLTPLGAPAALSSLMRNCVAGLGLPQVVEYFLRADLRDSAAKARIVASRLLASLSLVRRAKLYRFTLGNDPELNSTVLKDFLEKM